MGLLKNNISIGWYGGCDSCEDLDLYTSEGNLDEKYEKLILVLQISETGYVYKSWTHQQHEKQKKSFNGLPDSVKKTIDELEYITSGQSITKLMCGTPYIIEIQEGSEIDIPNFFKSGSEFKDAGRVIECFDCPTFPPCVCE